MVDIVLSLSCINFKVSNKYNMLSFKYTLKSLHEILFDRYSKTSFKEHLVGLQIWSQYRSNCTLPLYISVTVTQEEATMLSIWIFHIMWHFTKQSYSSWKKCLLFMQEREYIGSGSWEVQGASGFKKISNNVIRALLPPMYQYMWERRPMVASSLHLLLLSPANIH